MSAMQPSKLDEAARDSNSTGVRPGEAEATGGSGVQGERDEGADGGVHDARRHAEERGGEGSAEDMVDRRIRQPSVRPGQTVDGGGRQDARSARTGNDYSKFAAPKRMAASSSSSPSGVLPAVGYAALAASTSTTSASRSNRERSEERDQRRHHHQQRSMARGTMNIGDDGVEGGGGTPSLHSRGSTDSGGRMSEGYRRRGDSRAGGSGRSLRSHSPPPYGARYCESPTRLGRGSPVGVDGRLSSRGGDGWGARGEGDDGYQRSGKPRAAWESSGRQERGGGPRSASARRAGPGGPPLNEERSDNGGAHNFGGWGGGHRFSGRHDNNHTRFQSFGGRRGGFSGRIDSGGGGGGGSGGGGRGRGRGRGRFADRNHRSS